jgi:hypothetical protein
MAVGTNENVKYQAAGNGSNTTFATLLVAGGASEIGVWITTAAGAVTAQVAGVDYTFSNLGGTATIVFQTAPPAGSTVTFLRKTAIAQALDLTYNERLPSIQIEAQLDALVRMIRDLDARATIAFPGAEPAGNPTTLSAPAQRKGKLLAFNNNTGAMEELSKAALASEVLGDAQAAVSAASASAASASSASSSASASASSASSSASAASASAASASNSASAASASASAAAASAVLADVTNTAVNAAIATDPAATRAAAKIIDADIVKKVQLKNTRIKLAARESAASGVPATAINIMVFGDSVSSRIAEESPLPGQDLVGYKLDQRSSVTAGTAPVVVESNEWLQGRYRNVSIGATILYAPSTAGTIDFRANRIGVGFITGPTGATFDLEYQLGSGSWTVAASGISTYSASAGGNYLTYTITNAALETVKVRVTNVVAGSGGGGATAKIIGCGFWLENYGGYVISRCDQGGLDNAFISTCPAATVSGVVAGLLPDIVMGSWLDTPAGWDEGGTYDTLYDKIKAGHSTCDFLLIGPPPQTDSYYTTYGDQDATMDAWAARNNESYISTKRMFHSWAAGVADGYLVGGVDVHMTTAGYQMRNYLIEQIVEAAIGRNGGSIVRISRRAIMRQNNTTNSKIWIGQGLQNNEHQGGIYLPGGNAFNSIQLGSTSSFVPANSLHCSFSGTIAGQDGELKWFPEATTVTWMSFAVSSGSTITGKITQSSSWPLRIRMKRSTGADPTDGEVAAEHGIIFMRLNGSSKMEFCAKFPSGVVQIIATEP